MGTVREKNTRDEEQNRNSRSDYSHSRRDVVDFANVMFCFEIRFWVEILGDNPVRGLLLLPSANLASTRNYLS
jgi:hypothetical protein